MKKLLSVFSVLFLVTSLVCFILAITLPYATGKFEAGSQILQIIVGACAAAIGVILILLSSILSRRV